MASRARTLLSTIARHRLDALLTPERRRALGLPGWVSWLLALNPMRLNPIGTRQEGERLRDALTELGPVYIKLGQMLSTRPDILLFFTDDQRPSSLGAYGNPVVLTPALDRVAERGLLARRLIGAADEVHPAIADALSVVSAPDVIVDLARAAGGVHP